ncbi:MAG: hypothetical protein LUD72_03155 [Bacteroidales bacterium]|nr:hypothetical protein [Bacteroidales bacterium]
MYANRVGAQSGTFTEGKVLGSTSVYTYIFGVDVILNLCVLLFGFYTAVKLGGYVKSYAYWAYVLGAVQIARIFLIPFNFLNKATTGTVMVDSYTFVWLVTMLVLSAACLIVAGVIGQIRATQREKFQSLIDNGEIDLESALKDEGDVLSKDESSLDIFGDDLDGGETREDDTSDESILESGTTNVGGEG